MKIRYLSDIHLEFWPAPDELPSVGEDLIVLAGDICTSTHGIAWAQRTFTDVPVVYVMGNHEYYGSDYNRLLGEARAMCARGNVHLLENASLDLNGFRILGCTLWTDFNLFGAERRSEALQEARYSMADYTYIRANGFCVWPAFTADRCHESRSWLMAQMEAADRPLIVATHHAPVYDTVNPNFDGDFSNTNFHNHWPELFRPPVKLWIHGHNHWCHQKAVNGIPVVTNQRGYPDESLSAFKWDRVVEVLP